MFKDQHVLSKTKGLKDMEFPLYHVECIHIQPGNMQIHSVPHSLPTTTHNTTSVLQKLMDLLYKISINSGSKN